MVIPDTTSAEAFGRYVGGTCLRAGTGDAWQDVKAWIIAPPRQTGIIPLPGVSETFLAWTVSGEVDFERREVGADWQNHRMTKHNFFLTSGAPPHDCRWTTVTEEPFESMLVFLELPLLQRAMEEVFGADAPNARLKDVSAFHDGTLNWMMEQLYAELLRPKASALLVQGLGHAMAIYLVRTYARLNEESHGGKTSLPGYKLRLITEWMATHFAEEFNLEQIAAQARLSKFHFHRLFKSATGLSPLQYHTTLRMNAARQLLRETKRGVVSVALEVGYTNPSHFARLFRRETGLTPSDYRKER